MDKRPRKPTGSHGCRPLQPLTGNLLQFEVCMERQVLQGSVGRRAGRRWAGRQNSAGRCL